MDISRLPNGLNVALALNLLTEKPRTRSSPKATPKLLVTSPSSSANDGTTEHPKQSHFEPQGPPQGLSSNIEPPCSIQVSSSICQIQMGMFDARTRCTYAMHIFEAPFQHMHIRYVCSKLLNDITYLFSCHFECCMLNLEIKTNH